MAISGRDAKVRLLHNAVEVDERHLDGTVFHGRDRDHGVPPLGLGRGRADLLEHGSPADDAGLDPHRAAKLRALTLVGLVHLALELFNESLVDRCGHRTYFPGWRKMQGERGCPQAGQLWRGSGVQAALWTRLSLAGGTRQSA